MYYVLLAEGFEEIEALTQTDVLRRANIEVKNVGVTGMEVTGSHNITVKADISIDEAIKNVPEGIIIPGGIPGTPNIAKCDKAVSLIKKVNDNKGLVAAICAAPSILGELGLLEGKKAICYPGFEDKLKGAKIVKKAVVKDGNIITSRGAGTAMDMALAIAEYITKNPSKPLAKSMIYG